MIKHQPWSDETRFAVGLASSIVVLLLFLMLLGVMEDRTHSIEKLQCSHGVWEGKVYGPSKMGWTVYGANGTITYVTGECSLTVVVSNGN